MIDYRYMAIEIERKILEINKRAVATRIKKLKPRPKEVFFGLMRVKYFDFPDRRIRKAKNLLRVRELAPQKGSPYCEIVYKKFLCVKGNCKHFSELEFKLEGAGQFSAISLLLKNLGLKQVLYYEKKRTNFAYKNIHFEIDEHPKIPPFLEIEAPSIKAVDAMVKTLSLSRHEQTAESIGELMRRKYPKCKLNGLKFK